MIVTNARDAHDKLSKVREEEQSEARTALEEALRNAKAEGPRCSTPQDRMAEASARVTRLKAALQLLGEGKTDAAPLKVALE